MSFRRLALPVALALLAVPAFAADDYQLGPDSQVKPGVPQGRIEAGTFESKTVYPGTTRKYWVYVPQQYDGKTPAAVMVFQDGATYLRADGAYRAHNVLDNLIYRGDIPVMIALFIDPGVQVADNRSIRQEEYDTLSDRYSKVIIDERE